ncbi:MGDG synthase family glycosyltransferase [Paenibacillus marinisediminis]
MFGWTTQTDKTHRTKVLVLTGSLGHGHVQAASAIEELMRKRYGNHIEVQIVNYLEQMAPHLHMVGSYCFVQWLKHFPGMYGTLFEWMRKDRKLAQFIKNVRLTSLRPLAKLIRETDPTIVVSTFPAASAAISKLKERRIINCPTATVITDHTDHSFWLHPYTDMYLVGSEHARQMLENQGIRSSKIVVTGIPVRPAFYNTYNKEELRVQHGLHTEKLTVLLMGGGCGLLDPAILHALESAAWAKDLQVVVVCGHNDKLQRELQHWSEKVSLNVHIKGYIDNIHEYMAMADVMITKSGGVTTAEAIAQHLPLIIYKPLPGQEQDNITYLLKTGLASVAEDVPSLLKCLSRFTAQPELLKEMRQAVQQEQSGTEQDPIDVIMQLKCLPAPAMRTAPSWFRRTVG